LFGGVPHLPQQYSAFFEDFFFYPARPQREAPEHSGVRRTNQGTGARFGCNVPRPIPTNSFHLHSIPAMPAFCTT
jgi:hypothetical protein